ncbi:unnamed protein product [Eruca vesicaria subsp. sativa]|uniref:Uncharacterized protein n=1 Tax=Eruca vesicaria subsp. sativa TaxID=29727 RepID=A0ABC8KMZ1_ERUVS|nr:unnamed protein product [Eruca vesicaria subsp. sativa]
MAVCFRDYDCNGNVDILQEFASDVAHKTWWKKARNWNGIRMKAEKGNYTDGHWKIKIKDKRLETCNEKFCYTESMLWHWGG